MLSPYLSYVSLYIAIHCVSHWPSFPCTCKTTMRFFSQIILALSVVVVSIGRHDDAGRGCSATTTTSSSVCSRQNHCGLSSTTSINGHSFRPKSRIIATSQVTSPLSAAVIEVQNDDNAMILQGHRGGATKPPPTTSAKANVPTNGLPKALAGAIIFAIVEKVVKMTLQQLQIAYPAQLGACIVLFIALCITDAMISPSLASNVYTFLTPGAALLAKWFPIFFIPGLVLLPLSPPIGGTADVRTVHSQRKMCILSVSRSIDKLTLESYIFVSCADSKNFSYGDYWFFLFIDVYVTWCCDGAFLTRSYPTESQHW